MDAFEESLNDILVDTFNYILKYEETSLKTISDMPVTVTEAHMIEVISKRAGISSVSDIAAQLGIAMPTATVALKKLEKKGFVIKKQCTEDGRRSIVSLTALGERINRAHNLFHRKMVRNISSGFMEDERAVLMAAMQKMREFFRKRVEA